MTGWASPRWLYGSYLGWLAQDVDFKEEEHPRDEEGQFTGKGGGARGGAKKAPAKPEKDKRGFVDLGDYIVHPDTGRAWVKKGGGERSKHREYVQQITSLPKLRALVKEAGGDPGKASSPKSKEGYLEVGGFRVDDRVKVSANYPGSAGKTGTVIPSPNKQYVQVKFDDGNTYGIDPRGLEITKQAARPKGGEALPEPSLPEEEKEEEPEVDAEAKQLHADLTAAMEKLSVKDQKYAKHTLGKLLDPIAQSRDWDREYHRNMAREMIDKARTAPVTPKEKKEAPVTLPDTDSGQKAVSQARRLRDGQSFNVYSSGRRGNSPHIAIRREGRDWIVGKKRFSGYDGHEDAVMAAFKWVNAATRVHDDIGKYNPETKEWERPPPPPLPGEED